MPEGGQQPCWLHCSPLHSCAADLQSQRRMAGRFEPGLLDDDQPKLTLEIGLAEINRRLVCLVPKAFV